MRVPRNCMCSNTLKRVCRSTLSKGLGITIASLRQAIWRRRSEVIREPMVTATVPIFTDPTDICRWVKTDCTLADALTKQMTPEKLVAAINTSTWSLQQPIESIVRKREKQRQGAAGKNRKKEKKEQQVQRHLEEACVEVTENDDPEDCSDYDDANAPDGAT